MTIHIVGLARAILICGVAAAAGCARQPLPFGNSAPLLNGTPEFIDPARVAAVDKEFDLNLRAFDRRQRNAFVAEKMYMIDRNYTDYEANLAKQDGFGNLANDIATLGMSSAAAVIPLGPTTKILNQTIVAATGARSAFDKDILLTHTIQSIVLQMRSDRASKAKTLLTRMGCPIDNYPLFMAMSDLETYRRAGTFEAALPNIQKTIALGEAASEASKNKGTSSDDVKKALTTLTAAVSKSDTTCPIN